jgi:hypothetical protein
VMVLSLSVGGEGGGEDTAVRVTASPQTLGKQQTWHTGLAPAWCESSTSGAQEEGRCRQWMMLHRCAHQAFISFSAAHVSISLMRRGQLH